MNAHEDVTTMTASRGSVRAAPEPWLFTLDHRKLALLHAIVAGLALVAGLFLAFGLALTPVSGSAVDAEAYRRLYTMHGLALVFLVALPALPGILGNWMLPELVGRDEMAWPRLNLLAFHLLLASAVLFLVAFLAAPANAGWSFAVPFAVASDASLAWCLGAILCAVGSFACAGANVLATVIASRRDGRTWGELSFGAWAFTASALVQVLAAPILVVALVLLFAQRGGAADAIGTAAADVSFDAWFWSWGHPAFCAMLLSAFAVVAEVLDAHAIRASGARRAASRAEVVALLAIVVLAFAAAGVHWIGRGADAAGSASASALGLVTGVPWAVLATTWIVRLAGGGVRVTAALGYALLFLVMLCAGGMTGVFLAILPTAAYLENSAFATGQFHYLVAGAFLSALFAGVYFLWPRWFGARVHEGWALFACFLAFVGLHMAFVPELVLGYLGQPRRAGELLVKGDGLALCSAVGSALVIVAIVVAGWNLLASVLDAEPSREDAR